VPIKTGKSLEKRYTLLSEKPAVYKTGCVTTSIGTFGNGIGGSYTNSATETASLSN